MTDNIQQNSDWRRGYPKKPWLAALLAFIFGSFGLLYTSFFGFLVAVIFETLIYIQIYKVTSLFSAVVILAVKTAIAVFAYIYARRTPDLSKLKLLLRIDRPNWVKAVMTPTLTIGLAAALAFWVGSFYSTNGISMEPTIRGRRAELVLVVKLPALRGPMTRGAVVLYHTDREPRPLFGRVVALAGDTVEMRKGLGYVNGQAVDDPIRIASLKRVNCINEDSEMNNFASVGQDRSAQSKVLVASGKVFILADNRSSEFMDSRFLGSVSPQDIRGVVRTVSRAPDGVTNQDCSGT